MRTLALAVLLAFILTAAACSGRAVPYPRDGGYGGRNYLEGGGG
jgi:hypothetical protein